VALALRDHERMAPFQVDRKHTAEELRVLGERLRMAREARGLSLRDLAGGAQSQYVAEVERGMRNPAVMTLHRFARRLDVPPEWLLSDSDEVPPSA
jgi:transcriptional regulator with XRE-family HTH domain